MALFNRLNEVLGVAEGEPQDHEGEMPDEVRRDMETWPPGMPFYIDGEIRYMTAILHIQGRLAALLLSPINPKDDFEKAAALAAPFCPHCAPQFVMRRH